MSFTIWFTGLSGAGKTTLSSRVYDAVVERGFKAELLDGDVIRKNLSQELGFSKQDRDIQVKRIGFVCRLLNKHDIVCVTALISPYQEARQANRDLIDNFVEVYVQCPLKVLEERDTKGLYAKALSGEIENFTGVSDPYEEPVKPDVVVNTDRESIDQSFAKIMDCLEQNGLL